MQIKTTIITTGETGMRHQALGLARCLSDDVTECVVKPSPLISWLPGDYVPKSFLSLPEINDTDVLISCGRRSVAYSIALKHKKPDLFSIYIQNPQINFKYFNLVVPMVHDNCQGENVLSVKTALHHLQVEDLNNTPVEFSKKLSALPKKKIAFILGGNTKNYTFSQANLDKVVEAIQLMKDQGYGILLSTARRTPQSIVDQLSYLEDEQCWFYLGKGQNPYISFLAEAEGFIATSDSVSMISEMLFTGKPVYLMDLDGFNKRLMRFKQTLKDCNMVKDWSGVFELYNYDAPDSKQSVAKYIKTRLFNK